MFWSVPPVTIWSLPPFYKLPGEIPFMSSPDITTDVHLRRPQRADARRNYEKVLAAAREVFAEEGTSAPLDDTARRADVGIATLYRHFPTRQHLLEAVYVGEFEAISRRA